MPIYNFDTHLGVDLTGSERKSHFRALENLWRRHGDEAGSAEGEEFYGMGRALERTPGYRRLLTLPDKVYSLFRCDTDNSLFIHAGKRLYRLTSSAVPALPKDDNEDLRRRTDYAPAALLRLKGESESAPDVYVADFLPERPIRAAEVGNALYFADGTRLYRYADRRLTAVAETGSLRIGGATITSLTDPYIPLRMLDGTEYEQRNLLTDRYRQRHTFRETDVLHCGNAPIYFVRTGKNEEGVECCRAEFCLEGDFGDTLVIPPSTQLDGVTCAVTDVSPNLLSEYLPYTTVVFPYTMSVIPEVGFSSPRIHTVRLPVGVNVLHMCFFNKCAPDLLIEYEGDAALWSKIQLKTDGYKGKYTLTFGYSETLTPYGIPLCEESVSVGVMKLDDAIISAGAGERFSFYPIRVDRPSNPNAPYTHIYILAHTPITPYGRTLEISACARPFRYQSKSSPHALKTTEGELRAHGISTGNASASDGETPEGKALLYGCRLLTAYDKRLFFSGLSVLPDVIFYSHEDADGNPDPTYVAAMNYMTDSDRMAVTGLYAAAGELCVTHAASSQGKLTTHTYDLPEQAHSLFLRLYPVRASYTVGRVLSATVYEGKLHLLTEEGILAYRRTSADGYLSAHCVSERISPVIRRICTERSGKSTPFFASLGNRLALFAGSALYFGDSALRDAKESAPYEWYPQSDVGAYEDDLDAYESCSVLPPSIRYAFFIGENNEKIPLRTESARKIYTANEIKFDTAKKYEDGFFSDVTVCRAKESGAVLDCCDYRVGGSLYAPSAAVLFNSLLVFGTESGALLAYNTDLDPEKAGNGYYLTDGHRATASLQTFAENGGTPTVKKRIRAGSSYVFLRPMAESAPTLTVVSDTRTRSLPLASAPFDFARLSFCTLCFTSEEVAAFPIPEHEDLKERAYLVSSDTHFAFLGISYAYDLKK